MTGVFVPPKNYVGAAINGWLMTIAAFLDFLLVSKSYPSLGILGWFSLLMIYINLPAMLNPHHPTNYN